MEEFPFSEAEWNRVSEASTAIVNASFAEDEILVDSLTAEMHAILDELESIHGQHPVLIETRGDYTTDHAEQVLVYEQALQLAKANNLPTYTIVVSMADVLIGEFGQLQRARTELLACQEEIEANGDEYEVNWWRVLLAKCTDADSTDTE